MKQGRLSYQSIADKFLESPLGRPLAPQFWSTYLRVKRGALAVWREDDGAWGHRFPEGVIIAPRAGGVDLRTWDTLTRDVYLWELELRPGSIIVDVGAGIGSEILTFSSIAGPEGLVVAIEAQPWTFDFLQRNVEANRLSNVRIHQLAVTDVNGTVGIESDTVGHLANSIVRSTGRSDTEEVPASRLDDLLGSVPTIDFLKMNIEGAEVDALRGAEQVLSRTRNVYISCHDFTGCPTQATRAQVIELLLRAGFELSFRRDDPRPPIADAVYGVNSNYS
jgi:FkbM family methyltransferase